MVFTTKFTKNSNNKAPVFAKKFAEGGVVPSPTEDPRKEYREARRTLKGEPPVTVAEGVMGAFSEAKARDNAFRDAIRRGALEKIEKSGYEK
jgi:hypothetical protein